MKDQKKNVSFNDADGFEYIIDLDDYVEFPADDPTDKVKVLRKSKLVGLYLKWIEVLFFYL